MAHAGERKECCQSDQVFGGILCSPSGWAAQLRSWKQPFCCPTPGTWASKRAALINIAHANWCHNFFRLRREPWLNKTRRSMIWKPPSRLWLRRKKRKKNYSGRRIEPRNWGQIASKLQLKSATSNWSKRCDGYRRCASLLLSRWFV